jgi:polyvinyl alcohol dehydrogenase (cytochrome)
MSMQEIVRAAPRRGGSKNRQIAANIRLRSISAARPGATLRATKTFSSVCVGALIALAGGTPAARAQAVDGARLFEQRCASCHAAAGSRAPAIDLLRTRAPRAIIETLVTGSMRVQGSRLSGPERRAIAEFVTGTSVGGDVRGAESGRCPATPSGQAPSAASRPTSAAAWSGWSPTAGNTRFQSKEQAGIGVGDLARLTLKWAFGFPDASVAWAQPAVADGRVFVGSQNGTVYALDARTGCIHWTFSATGGVRTAISIAGGRAYFGDTSANAYALDADTGALVWSAKVDEHPLARVTGSPALFEGRLYVPVSSYEESQGADPQYPCCTFRGSIVALEAVSGKAAWKTYLIPSEPQRRGTSRSGTPLWGPAGSAVWSAPTVDARRRRLYVATGNAYSAPAHASSDAVVALDLESGAIRWTRQATPNDVYLTGCRAGNPNCPEANGPDHDFGSPPMLVTVGGGRDLILVGQKSGMAYAMDPESNGEVVWQYRAGQGGALGGIEWGAASDSQLAYFAVSDMTTPQPGGLHAVNPATGERAWFAHPRPLACGSGRGCSAAQSAAITVIPGAVLSGANDGSLRAYSAADGAVVWEFDTNRDFQTVNGVPAKGASMQGPGPVVAGGMLYVSSGYGAFGGRPGNVLLAFGLE